MREIPLTQGKVALIDDEDWELISQYSWHAHPNHERGWYARTGAKPEDRQMMHRLICGLAQKDPRQVDHRNGDGLDNQRGNLRVCTRYQNAQNRKLPTSGFKGVNPVTHHSRLNYVPPKPWKAALYADGCWIYLGTFFTAEDAARAYDYAALTYHGEFARPNFEDSRYLVTVEALLSA